MEHAGMVHALQEIRRQLKPDGVLINLLPVPEGSLIEVHQDGEILFAERRRETCSENVLQAEASLKQTFDRELFVLDQQERLSS